MNLNSLTVRTFISPHEHSGFLKSKHNTMRHNELYPSVFVVRFSPGVHNCHSIMNKFNSIGGRLVEDWWVSSGEAGTKCPFLVGSVGNFQGRGEHTHLWGFLPFGVRMLFVVPNPAGSLTTPIQGYERTYRSAPTQMDLCQLVFVTSE